MESRILEDTVCLRKHIVNSYIQEKELLNIFTKVSFVDYLKPQSMMGGYISHQKKLVKRRFF